MATGRVPHNEKGPDRTTLRRWLSEGMTQEAIRDRWFAETGQRCARSTVGMAIARYGLKSARPRPRYPDHLPWRVIKPHDHHYDARMLRFLGRRQTGEPMSTRDNKLLDAWLRELDNADAVVTYHPRLPDGFRWVPREPQDDGGYIRRPPPTGD